MKKRTISALLTILMLLTLTACGGDSQADTAGGDAAGDDAYQLSVILKTTASEHWQLIMAGCRAFEAEHPDVKIEVVGPASETSYDDQQNMIETALNNPDVDALIIAPLQSETAANLISGEERPVFAMDTNIDAPEIVSFIGTGNEEAAKLGATEAVAAAKASGHWDKIECIEIAGVQGDATNTARMNGYIAGITENGGTFLTDEVQYANAVADQAVVCMEAVIQTRPEGVAIVCANNDDMAVAAVRAAEGQPGYEHTIFLGFDGSTGACQAILDGDLTMSVAQKPYEMGYLACQAAYETLQGNKVESFIDSQIEVITPENAQARIDAVNAYLGS
ncbi:sugar ABC transporter substrate-binding protein [uncultured Dysosmobacter sp.]|uniref:sugar ABC transporter substrate-binding protein n=1 Tax=uncultured Dysosmobacter sp. TaxID=2591384 RepID=UPI00262444B6|nr:sugar ABC transporter substrate-binding protein [uncultured Dysosmobacter sp.]